MPPSTSTPHVYNAAPLENSLYVGINVQEILYGIELFLYFKTMRIFIARRRRPHNFDAFYAIFSTVMLLVLTFWVAIISILGQDMWLLDRTYPGGPMAFVTEDAALFFHCMAAATIILEQMTNGLMVYRCLIVWNSLRLIIIPSFLWLSNLVIGIASAATAKHGVYIGASAKLSFEFYISSVFLSTTLTCMICGRLLHHAKKMKECLGREFASPYFTIVTLIVESVLPYTLAGIAFLVSFGVVTPVGMALSCVYTLMMCISPQMLILRVAEGVAWRADTVGVATSQIVFSPSRGGELSGPNRLSGSRPVVKHLESFSSAESGEGSRKSCEAVVQIRVGKSASPICADTR